MSSRAPLPAACATVAAEDAGPTEPARPRARRVRTFSIRQAVLLGGVHVAAVAALFVPTRAGAAALVVAYLLTGFGISLGYHRGLSHGAFRARPALSSALVVLGALALQGGPITWCGFHRAHHRFGDAQGDPHAASRGLFFSHVGWALQKGPNGYRRQRLRHLTAGLERRPLLRWLERHHLVLNLAAFLAVWLLAGLAVASWAFPLRIVLLWHVTWCTNSVAHAAHTRSPAPRNVTWLAVVGFGEGLHKNHHDAPSVACFARAPGQIDPGYWVLALLARLRLAVVPPRPLSGS